MIERAGELAALSTAACWVVTAVSFELAGKRVGSLSVNLIRLCMATVPLALWSAVSRGVALPLDASLHSWGWLSISGLIGFVLGDLCLFRAFVLIGPRLASLIMASVPVWTSLFGLLILEEHLAPRELLGVALIVGGIGWAVSQRRPSPNSEAEAELEDPAKPPKTSRFRLTDNGIFLAFAGAFGQAGGLVLSKYGMGDYDPFAATQIRVFAGVAGFLVVVTLSGWWPRIGQALRDTKAMVATGVGAIFGPFLGVGLSLVAVQLAPTGVAASLMATTPILLLPVSRIRGEHIGWAGALGAVFAVAGVALLLL